MKINWKRLLNQLFMLATLLFIVILAFSNNEMADAWGTLFTLDRRWVMGALLGWFCYLGFDALSLYHFLRTQNHRVPLYFAGYISLIGFYYSNITPGASGGQPMQIYYMNKRGVPVGIGTSGITLKFFCMQFMVVFMGLVLWLCNYDAMAAQLGGVKWLIIIGGLINFAAVPLVLLAGFNRPLLQVVVNFVIRLAGKVRLVKSPEDTVVRVSAVLDTYHASILRVSSHPWHVVLQLLLAGVSMGGLMSIPVCVYYAFGLSGTPWHHILTISFLLFWSASYTPLPGASGAQEAGFLGFFRGIFTSGTIGLALLTWRFFGYYLFLIMGAAVTILSNLAASRRKKKEPPVLDPSVPEKAEEEAPEVP